MIDEFQPKTRVVAGATIDNGESFSRFGTFLAEEDLTLVQVHFVCDPTAGSKQMAVSTDPWFTRPPTGTTSNEFQLRSSPDTAGLGSNQSTSYTNLAFPVPKGTKLYWGVNGLATPDQLIFLVFT